SESRPRRRAPEVLVADRGTQYVAQQRRTVRSGRHVLRQCALRHICPQCRGTLQWRMRSPSGFSLALAAVLASTCGRGGRSAASTPGGTAPPGPATTASATASVVPAAAVSATRGASSAGPALARDLQEIVDRFRKIIVLVEDQADLDAKAR